MTYINAITLLLSCLVVSSCSEATPTGETPINTIKVEPKGGRQLVIDLNEAANESFDKTIAEAKEVGASGSNLSIAWSQIETLPGQYQPVIDLLAIAEAYFPAVNFSILLMIGPVDTNVDRMPSDLKGKSFDDPEVIARFKSLLNHVFTKIPDLKLDGIALGNEVDVFLGADSAAWNAYTRFYNSAVTHIKTIRPDLPVGVKMTLSGLTGPFATEAKKLNSKSDLILATYYPLSSGNQVNEPAVVTTDFATLVANYPTRPIRLAELGYPSSSANGSSEEKQADFIRESFSAWDKEQDHIIAISFSIMTDRSTEEVEEFGRYYGISDNPFLEFLRTLGLRNHDGTHKLAFTKLAEEAKKRGW